ncbi:MAG TPA: glucokinase [Verrucomicrobiae bacterium]|jgi:glucokinase|nr:glucokinase [Verrucomicrobiae bacterium]
MILAGDIGGTKVNLAFFGEGLRLMPENFASYPSRDYTSLEAIAQQFLSERKLKADYACFGIAGPVKKGRVSPTNLPWIVTEKELKQSLHLKDVWIINDLEANAHGVRGLSAKDFVTLNEGEEGAVGNAAIISAGTGLGEAGLFWDGNRHLPVASEGGHSDFAPRTDLDIELLVYLRKRFAQVDWEAVLAGPSLYHIYEFLRQRKGNGEPAWLAAELGSEDPPKVITRAALENKSDICAQALDMFVDYYGAEAANLALKVLATGGVYVGGGIAPKIIAKLSDGRFMKAFVGEGRMKDLLAAMPVHVIMNDKTALIGAARFAAMQSGKIL